MPHTGWTSSWSRRAARRSATPPNYSPTTAQGSPSAPLGLADVARDFGFVRFESGDIFTEYYWRDRWYAVKEVRDSTGTLKGWYTDITRPAVLSGTELVVEDLDLDLWRSADGRTVLRLDEDEFAASGLPQTDPDAASAAMSALDELELLAREGDFEALLA